MKTRTTKRGMLGVALMIFGGVLSACAMGGTTWKEEVLLHDGKKLIVERSQTYGGRHEIGQSPPIEEHSVSFRLPNSGKTITWISEYGEELGRTNFKLLAVHVLHGAPYIVASPSSCLSYNKWGRPNPPYVLFKYDGNRWQRIPLSELPAEFKAINVVLDTYGHGDVDRAVNSGFISAAGVKSLNNDLTQPEYKNILREPVKGGAIANCGEMIYDGKAGWIGIGWFRKQASYEACMSYCEQEKVPAQYCPCNKLFRGK